MKAVLRILGLTLAVIAVFHTPASAFLVTCYYWCPEGRRTNSMTYEDCCGGGGSGYFPCSDGSQGFPYGYEAWSGPQFC